MKGDIHAIGVLMKPNPERCTVDNYIQRVLDRSPKVKSPSGREYNLFALKALVLALRTCRIERDRRGNVTKRWGRYTWWDDRKGRR